MNLAAGFAKLALSNRPLLLLKTPPNACGAGFERPGHNDTGIEEQESECVAVGACLHSVIVR